ncbi:MAG: (Fe-S)-binding protein [Thermodesulfobacteriota bacterium]
MAARSGLERWFPRFFDKFGALTTFDLLKEYLGSGRIKIDQARLSGRATYHDPCNYGRKSKERFGQAFYEEGRWVMDQCFDDWVDLYPNRGNQYCCGGGGGAMLTPFTEERLHYGRRKMEQIRRSGADLIVVPCHSCHGQFKAMIQALGLKDLKVKYLWEVVAEALVVV